MRSISTQLEDHLKVVTAGPRQPQNIFCDGTTYQEVYDMAGHLVPWFKNAAATDTVMLCVEEKTVVMAALLAAMATQKTMLMPTALETSALEALIRGTGCRYAVLDRHRPLPEGVEGVLAGDQGPSPGRFIPEAPLDLDAVWVKLFTGGSTAAPQVWEKTVRNLMGEAVYLSRTFGVDSNDLIVATVPAYHIYGLLYSVLMPFVASAGVCGDTPYYPNEIVETARRRKASILVSVPPHYHALGDQGLDSPRLRLAFSSAGMLAEEDGERFSRVNGVDLVEIYGSTETGGIASRVRAKGEKGFTPFECVEVRMDDERLWVRSEFLSPGLVGRTSPFFQMGDRVEVMEKGAFALLGREDGVIKVGGRRVSLEMVRKALLNQPGVTDAVVLSREATGGRENQIVAVVEGLVNTATLSEELAGHLAPYARPRCIKIVAEMPFTAAGKYDRNALLSLFDP